MSRVEDDQPGEHDDRDDDRGWYAVRCVFASETGPDGITTYEERVTLWRAGDLDEAIAQAETEALVYAATIEEAPVTYLGLAQAFHLFDEPGEGAEIFSLMRDSALGPEDYIEEYFDSGEERQSNA
jgi:hypothetical protein